MPRWSQYLPRGVGVRRTPAYTRTYAVRSTRAAVRPRKRRVVARYNRRVTVRRRASRVRTMAVPLSAPSWLRNKSPFLRAALAKSACSMLWLRSIINPWSAPIDACNPTTPPIYSERVRAMCRANITASANSPSGTGTMFAIMCRFTPANNNSCMRFSDTTAWVTANNVITVLSLDNNHNGPYAGSDFNVAPLVNMWCPVSMGLRIRYTGTADNMGGSLYFFESPAHRNVATSGQSLDVINSDPMTVIKPISYDWQSVVWTGPGMPAETQYSNSIEDTTLLNPFCLYIFGQCATTAGVNFQVEYWTNFEVTGKIARRAILSEFDQTGAYAASNTLKADVQQGTFTNGPPDDEVRATFATDRSREAAGSYLDIVAGVAGLYALDNLSVVPPPPPPPPPSYDEWLDLINPLHPWHIPTWFANE